MDKQSLFARALTAVLLLASLSAVHAQEMLTSECSQIQAGDSLVITKTEYIYTNATGEDSYWDYSGLEEAGSYVLKFDTLNSKQLVGYDPQKIWKYQTVEKGLFLSGYEDNLYRVDFKDAQLILPLPLQYGQSYNKAYQGEGLYCGTHYIRVFGTVKTTADAQGTLILPETDTLYNTLRVYTVDTEAVRLSKDSCRNDSDNLKQVITERHQWFARGYRYPVLETVSSSTYHNLNHIATQQYGLLCPPGIQTALSDAVNEQIRRDDAMARDEWNAKRRNCEENSSGTLPQDGSNSSGFTYDIQTSGSQVSITYSLESAARLHVMVVNAMGMVYRDTLQDSPAVSHQLLTIDCSGLRRGQYIIYMNVNGSIYNHKIAI